MRSCLLVVVVALAAVGCKKSETASAKAGSGSAGSATAPSAAAAVQIVVDDQVVGTLAPEQAKMWPRLDTLVPVAARRVGMWDAIEIRGKAGATLKQPSSTYPDKVAALFPSDTGISFGIFDPVELAQKGKPVVRHDGITEVRLALAKGSGRGENEHGDGGGSDPTKLVLTIKTKAGQQTLEGTKLIAMPREAPPGEADPHAGWRLLTVLEAQGIKGCKRLLLTDATGTNLTLEKQDLDPATAVPFLKLNRQGTIRFRVFRKQGETWQMGSDLRGLTTIEVLE